MLVLYSIIFLHNNRNAKTHKYNTAVINLHWEMPKYGQNVLFNCLFLFYNFSLFRNDEQEIFFDDLTNLTKMN